MIKEWFILIDGNKEGPFSYLDLKRDRRLTWETLVWKQGFKKWLPIKDVPELSDLFKFEDKSSNKEGTALLPCADDSIVLDARSQPPYFFWLLVAVISLMYFFIYLYIGRH